MSEALRLQTQKVISESVSMNFPATAGVRRSLLLTVFVAAVGITTSTILWLREREHIQRDETQDLALLATRITDELRVRLAQIDSTLQGLRGLYAAQGGLDHASWETYLNELNPSPPPGLNGFNYIRHVSPETLPAFLDEAHLRFAPDFKIQVTETAAEMAIVSLQRDYLNRGLSLGADRSTRTDWMISADLARRTGATTMSQPTAALSGDGSLRFFVTMPLYRIGVPVNSESARLAAHHGWLTAGLRPSAFFEYLDSQIGRTLRLEVTDIAPDGTTKRLHLSSPGEKLPANTITSTLTVPIMDRTWRVDLTAPPGPLASSRYALAGQLFVGGLIATGLLTALLWNLRRTQREAIRLAREMTREVKEREWMLIQAQRIANIGMCYLDTRTQKVVRSAEYLRIFGIQADQSMVGGATDDLLDRVHPEDRPAAAAAITAFKAGQPAPPRIIRIRTPDRGERTLLGEQGVLPSPSGKADLVVAVIHDITERLATDRALADSHARLDRLIQVLPGTVYQLRRDSSGTLTLPFLSEGASQLFGLPAAELAASPARLLALFPADQAALLQRSLDQSAATLAGWQLDASFQPPGGGRRWVRFNAIPEATPGGAIVWHGVATDISLAKEAEHRLRFTQYAVDHMRDAVAFLTADGDRIYVNDETCRLTGYDRAELVGAKVWNTFTSITPARYQQLWAHVKQRGTYLFESSLISKSGETVPVEVGASYIDFGGLEIVFAIARDITARKASEQALRDSEERLRLTRHALDLAQDIVSIMDADGNRLYVNETFCRFTGRTRDEIFSTKVWETNPPLNEPRYRALWEDVRRRGTMSFDLEMLSSTGEHLPIEVNASFLTFDGREAVCTISRDLGPRRAAEAEKKRMEEQLRETQKLESLGVLAGGIAHDFNNLLTGILGHASLARDRLPDGHEMHESLSQIEQSSTRAAELCQQMLAYAGKGRFIVGAVDLSKLVGDTAKLLDVSIEHRAALTLNLAQNLPAVLADATQMRQIVMNLVLNAAEAVTPDTGRIVVTTGRMHVDAAFLASARVAAGLRHGEAVFLEVTDNGCGMDPATLERIFDPFFTTKFTGRGLGLAAVQGIVRSHEGALHVHSSPGGGTTFRLVLAPYTGSKARTMPPFAPARNSRPPIASGRVLVVDDEESVRSVTRQVLERTGFTVELAEDGESALEHLKRSPSDFTLILLDFTMPRLDGAQTLREILQIHPNARVMMMSGFSETEARQRLGDLAIVGFIQKPFDFPTLRTRVEQVLQLDPASQI
ncbi:PAS domain S-box protein [Nibricoccus aquaticus]|nr:PAS domain S-box protein [Nibricoccus aquaticus]